MHEKMLENGKAVVKPGFEERNTTRTVLLPTGLTEQDLVQLSPAEIDQIIRQAGPAVGYASMFKLASGSCGVKETVQYHAAKFLVERAAELEKEAQKDADKEGLGKLTAGELDALIKHLENSGVILETPTLNAEI